jgi:hypothetical protein
LVCCSKGKSGKPELNSTFPLWSPTPLLPLQRSQLVKTLLFYCPRDVLEVTPFLSVPFFLQVFFPQKCNSSWSETAHFNIFLVVWWTFSLPAFSCYNLPKGEKYTKLSQNYQIAIKYTNIFYSKALQNVPKWWFWVWKRSIWQLCCRAWYVDELVGALLLEEWENMQKIQKGPAKILLGWTCATTFLQQTQFADKFLLNNFIGLAKPSTVALPRSDWDAFAEACWSQSYDRELHRQR